MAGGSWLEWVWRAWFGQARRVVAEQQRAWQRFLYETGRAPLAMQTTGTFPQLSEPTKKKPKKKGK